MTQRDEILTTKEVMDYLKITRPTIFKMIKNGRLKAARVGRDYRFYKNDVDRFLRESIEPKTAVK